MVFIWGAHVNLVVKSVNRDQTPTDRCHFFLPLTTTDGTSVHTWNQPPTVYTWTPTIRANKSPIPLRCNGLFFYSPIAASLFTPFLVAFFVCLVHALSLWTILWKIVHWIHNTTKHTGFQTPKYTIYPRRDTPIGFGHSICTHPFSS